MINIAVISCILLSVALYVMRLRAQKDQASMASSFIASYTPDRTSSNPARMLDRSRPNQPQEKYSQITRKKRTLAFYLPLTIERLVMSVQSGLDIGPAIERLVANRTSAKSVNPCDDLFSTVLALNNSGLTLEESLNEVSNSSPFPMIKHTFAHLASAQRDGGDILCPLIELADATQQAYQEEMEEEIAKLPIKATLPLILTFAGLLICMMTPPILQVLSLISKSRTGGL